MKATIKTPSDKFHGKRCGVSFRRGVAEDVEVTETQLKGFRNLGYMVIPAEVPAPKKAEPEKPAKEKPAKAKPAAKKAAKSGE